MFFKFLISQKVFDIELFSRIAQQTMFTVNVAKTVEEACKLVAVGFEYVCEYGDAKKFRKRR